ncbi:MAG: CBS domain-containing protein, partial [Pyrinomonadaceae bacterium]|nr:CBS domain-containing protein [Pyrinomonadaceae bacterium]
MEIEIAIAVLLLVLMTFLATVDMAFVHLSDLSLRRLTSDTVENVRVDTDFLRNILRNRPRFRFALSAAIQILLIIFSVIVTFLTFRFFPNNYVTSLLISASAGLILSGTFRQFIPRIITASNPEAVLLFLLPFVQPFYGTFAFISDPFESFRSEKNSLETTIIPNQTEESKAESAAEESDSLQTLIEAGEAEGIIEERERELIETMISFGDTRANEVMTPRTEIYALPLNATIKEARDLIIESKYSRIPVYRDSVDNVEGVIYVRDLLQFWTDAEKENQRLIDLPNLLRSVYFVPETKYVAELLKEMQTARVQMAMVIDEYGGIAGLVTVEDILEELVGEIEDEDTEQGEIVEIIESPD